MTIIDQGMQVLANLQRTVAQLRQENRYLRRTLGGKHLYHYNTSGRVLRRALDDAKAMLVLAFSGFPISRHYCCELGYSERQYYWAVGLLRSARVMESKGKDIVVDDFTVAEQKLQARYEALKDQPNALETLRMYMPRKMDYMYKGHRES